MPRFQRQYPLQRGKVDRPRPRRRLSAAYTEAEIRELLAACDKGAGWDRAHGQRVEVRRPSSLRDRAVILVLLLKSPMIRLIPETRRSPAASNAILRRLSVMGNSFMRPRMCCAGGVYG